jgi:hypothetical protein
VTKGETGTVALISAYTTSQGEEIMKKMVLVIAAASLMAAAPLAALAAMEHDNGSMKMDHDNGSMKMDHKKGGMMSMGKLAHQEVVDGVKATFKIMDIKAKMKEMGMKETHHLMVEFTDAKSGKNLSEGTVMVKIMAPDKSEKSKELMAMPGMEGMGAGFGSDLEMPKKGKYGVMTKFKLKDGKVRMVKFWYTVK